MKDPKISRLLWIWNKLRHGLVMHGIRNRLARIGLDIRPYYWVLEGGNDCKQPEIKGSTSEYSLEFLGPEDIKAMDPTVLGYKEEEMLGYLKNGKKCIGLKYKDEIAAFMWLEFIQCDFKYKITRLQENEAYLFNMHTMESFRGKNLAPYLRYQSYEILKNLGRDTFYSISEYFNSATLKFKRKLNAKNLKLILNIELFKKFHWNITLRTYHNH